MAEPQPFTIPAPVKATEIPPKRDTGANHGPNEFLVKRPPQFPDGWLAKSYDDNDWYDVGPVQGHWETGEVLKGKNKGAPIDRMTGQAEEVRRQLREAAAALGIGVSIKYFAVVNKAGTGELKDRLLIKYLGQKAKQYTKKAAPTGAPVEAPAETPTA